jgi:dolichol-phosphate mannosyltransferase
MSMSISVVIPCYNEADNAPMLRADLLPILLQLADRGDVEVVFVNDGSRDDTRPLLERLCVDFREYGIGARVVSHPTNLGLGAAIRTGFSAARGEVVITTDCDATYRFDEIPKLLDMLVTEELDLVTGSQYHPRGAVANVPGYRLVLSRGSSWLYRLVVSRRLHTYTSLFRAYRRPLLDATPFTSNGFLAGTEIIVNAYLAGYRVGEYPTVLHGRLYGTSKAKLLRTIGAHLRFLGHVAAARLGIVSAPWAESAARMPMVHEAASRRRV